MNQQRSKRDVCLLVHLDRFVRLQATAPRDADGWPVMEQEMLGPLCLTLPMIRERGWLTIVEDAPWIRIRMTRLGQRELAQWCREYQQAAERVRSKQQERHDG